MSNPDDTAIHNQQAIDDAFAVIRAEHYKLQQEHERLIADAIQLAIDGHPAAVADTYKQARDVYKAAERLAADAGNSHDNLRRWTSEMSGSNMAGALSALRRAANS